MPQKRAKQVAERDEPRRAAKAFDEVWSICKNRATNKNYKYKSTLFRDFLEIRGNLGGFFGEKAHHHAERVLSSSFLVAPKAKNILIINSSETLASACSTFA